MQCLNWVRLWRKLRAKLKFSLITIGSGLTLEWLLGSVFLVRVNGDCLTASKATILSLVSLAYIWPLWNFWALWSLADWKYQNTVSKRSKLRVWLLCGLVGIILQMAGWYAMATEQYDSFGVVSN
jgi:hypothetical protein